MAANIEHSTNEKDGSLQSSVGRPGPHGAAHELDAHRRAALAQADNAQFSSVLISSPFSPSLVLTPLLPLNPGGSTQRFALSPARVSSPMRECDSQFTDLTVR
jgi:hypothetical protein